MKQPLVSPWSMGVNSTAVLIGLAQRGIRPDFIPCADTKGEKGPSYAYIPLMQEWLQSVGFPYIHIVTRSDYAKTKDPSLEAQCLRLGVLPSLAYGWKTCSLKWKKEPQDRWLRQQLLLQQWWASGQKALKTIGYEQGEEYRAEGKTGDFAYDLWFPLLEWGWDRDCCADEIIKAGLPVPPKSACFFCPAMKPYEIIQLGKDEPEKQARALEIERRALAGEGEGTFKTSRTIGLGRRFSWASVVANEQVSPVETEFPCECSL